MDHAASSKSRTYDDHVKRVAVLGLEIARRLGHTGFSLERLEEAAQMRHTGARAESGGMERLTDWFDRPAGEAPLSNETVRILGAAAGRAVADQDSARLGGALAVADAFDDLLEFRQFEPRPVAGLLDEMRELSGFGFQNADAVNALASISTDISRSAHAAADALPVSAVAALRKLALVRSDEVTLEMLCEVAMKDPVIAGGILRVVNSAAYSPAKPFTSVRQGIAYLGVESARKVVLACAGRALCASASLRAIWQHSLAVASYCHEMARSCGIGEDEAFLAGLLHDVGRIALATLRTSERASFLNLSAREIPCEWAEWIAFQHGHAELGADILERWKVPALIVEAIRDHHAPERSESRLASLLYIAEIQNDDRESVWAPYRFSFAIANGGLKTAPVRSESRFSASLQVVAA